MEEKIVEALEMTNSESYAFFDRKTGEILWLSEYDDDNEEKMEKIDCDPNIVALPTQYDINEYSVMCGFAESRSDHTQSEALLVCLRGAGAFRRFKDMINVLAISGEWYEYRRNAYLNIARDWCERNGIAL